MHFFLCYFLPWSLFQLLFSVETRKHMIFLCFQAVPNLMHLWVEVSSFFERKNTWKIRKPTSHLSCLAHSLILYNPRSMIVVLCVQYGSVYDVCMVCICILCNIPTDFSSTTSSTIINTFAIRYILFEHRNIIFVELFVTTQLKIWDGRRLNKSWLIVLAFSFIFMQPVRKDIASCTTYSTMQINAKTR